MNKISEWVGGLIGLWIIIMLPFLVATALGAILDYKDTCRNMTLRRAEYIFPARQINCWVWDKVDE